MEKCFSYFMFTLTKIIESYGKNKGKTRQQDKSVVGGKSVFFFISFLLLFNFFCFYFNFHMGKVLVHCLDAHMKTNKSKYENICFESQKLFFRFISVFLFIFFFFLMLSYAIEKSVKKLNIFDWIYSIKMCVRAINLLFTYR